MKLMTRIPLMAMAAALVIGLGSATAGGADVAQLYRLSYQAEARGKAMEALAAIKKVESQAGPSYFVHARIGWLAYVAGRHAEAVAAYTKAAATAPQAIEPRLGLTAPLLALKQWRKLELACRDVLKLDPKNALARARLAHAHYMVGNYPDSATHYRSLVAEYPADLNHRTGLGWSLARMGRRKEAKVQFAAVLAVSPDNPNAKQGMALP
jgi:tetratricopeptide (TPR) repeat protein